MGPGKRAISEGKGRRVFFRRAKHLLENTITGWKNNSNDLALAVAEAAKMKFWVLKTTIAVHRNHYRNFTQLLHSTNILFYKHMTHGSFTWSVIDCDN